jgi:hypothetical protein
MANKPKTAVAKTEAKVSPKVSAYKTMLTSYKEMKQVNKTLGGARSWVLNMNEQLPEKQQLTELQINILKATKKAENYKFFANYVRKHHTTGNYSPFYVLQSIVKNEKLFQERFKF